MYIMYINVYLLVFFVKFTIIEVIVYLNVFKSFDVIVIFTMSGWNSTRVVNKISINIVCITNFLDT